MRNLIPFISGAALMMFASCNNGQSSETKTNAVNDTAKTAKVAADSSSPAASTPPAGGKIADAQTILARTQVPILCYHHIRPTSAGPYTVPEQNFIQHVKALKDSGYHTVTCDQLYNYLAYGAALPSKPVMITYDDTDLEQFTIGKREMDKYGFKGVYFIEDITMGKKNYMTRDQIKQLSDEGHTVASHTWDHHRADRYQGTDWQIQVAKPKAKLEGIIGKKVDYFAYPFGVWKHYGVDSLRANGITMAFQLADARDSLEPLYTVRRIIVAPTWSGEGLVRSMKASFKGSK